MRAMFICISIALHIKEIINLDKAKFGPNARKLGVALTFYFLALLFVTVRALIFVEVVRSLV